MSDKRFDYIYSLILKSYPNACILYIDEVVNETLLNSYNELRTSLEKVTTIQEKQLFHGTMDSLIDVIAGEGFDPTKNKTSIYGYGTYFAVNAGYSYNYMKGTTEITYMFLADVLVGRLTTGKRISVDGNYTWDNNVDNIHFPTIYTTPYHYGAYPRYIIAFHKNAK